MKTFIASDSSWEKEIKLKELASEEETIFEACTRAVEWALSRGKPVGMIISLTDPEDEEREFLSISYKILTNAGYFALAEKQRQAVKEELGIDLATESLEQIIAKLYEASIKKLFCIAKMTKVIVGDREKMTPVVCLELGIYEDEEPAKRKCKELNSVTSKNMFVVKKIICNKESA